MATSKAAPTVPEVPTAHRETHAWQQAPTGSASRWWWLVNVKTSAIVGRVRYLNKEYEAFAGGGLGEYTTRDGAVNAVHARIFGRDA